MSIYVQCESCSRYDTHRSIDCVVTVCMNSVPRRFYVIRFVIMRKYRVCDRDNDRGSVGDRAKGRWKVAGSWKR